MKMSIPIMGPTTDFKKWKRNLLSFLSLKAAYLIPQMAISESASGCVSRRNTTPTNCYFMKPAPISALTWQ
jgi:spore cortex formation protein SpoVR/YcgB (stage V sporulation)